MSDHTLSLTDELYRYLRDVSLREPELLRRLRAETQRLEMARMQISPEQGQFMRLVAMLVGARKAIEIGTFTGYSAISVALALPPAGRLVAWDVRAEERCVGKGCVGPGSSRGSTYL